MSEFLQNILKSKECWLKPKVLNSCSMYYPYWPSLLIYEWYFCRWLISLLSYQLAKLHSLIFAQCRYLKNMTLSINFQSIQKDQFREEGNCLSTYGIQLVQLQAFLIKDLKVQISSFFKIHKVQKIAWLRLTFS